MDLNWIFEILYSDNLIFENLIVILVCRNSNLSFKILLNSTTCYYLNSKKVNFDFIDRRIGRQSNLFKHSLIELNRGGLNDHNNNRKSSSEQNQRPDNNSDTTTVTATETTMTAANYFTFLAAKSEVTITSHVNSAMNYPTSYPAQQIISVNRFTTNQYIINTGGQVQLQENLVKLTQDGHYGMNIASCNNNTDLNGSQIGLMLTFSFNSHL